VRKAGTAVGMDVQLMCPASPIIIAPTSTSTGDVATEGTDCAVRGGEGGAGGMRSGGQWVGWPCEQLLSSLCEHRH
jgi:hypothetical protein